MLTQKGLSTWEKVRKYNTLSKHYDEMNGSIFINEEDFKNEVQKEAMDFLKVNRNWVMGIQEIGKDEKGSIEYGVYIVDREDLEW